MPKLLAIKEKMPEWSGVTTERSRLGGIEFFEINNPDTLLTRRSRLKVFLLKTTKENTNQQDGWFETIVVD